MISTPDPIVLLTRTLSAGPALVSRAWLDPALVQRWMWPDGLATTGASIEARVGGRFSVHQVDRDGTDVGGFEAEIVELIEDRRIVFRWSFVGPDRQIDPDHES